MRGLPRVRRNGIFDLDENVQLEPKNRNKKKQIKRGVHRKISFEKKFSYLRPPGYKKTTGLAVGAPPRVRLLE